MTRHNYTLVLGALIGPLILLLAHSCTAHAHASARPIPASEWTPIAADTLATVLAVEGCNRIDRRAVPWVLARRWRMQRQGWTYAQQAARYSYPLASGRVKVRPATAAERLELDAWARGEVADPCSGAIHFASPAIVPASHPLLISCAGRNRYLRGRR